MPSLKLSNPFRRGTDRPSLKQRAAALRATATNVIGRPKLMQSRLADPSYDKAPIYDLSACTLPQLARLYEASQGLFRYLASTTDAHFFSTGDGRDFTPAGKVLDKECSRVGILLDAILREVRERTPTDQAERQERARVLVLYELSNSSVIEDADVLEELVAATAEA